MPRISCVALAVGLACLTLSPASAQDGGSQQRTLAVQPNVAVTQIFSDNYDLSANGRSDSITRLSAGLGLRGRTGALRGFLDYTLSSLNYARHTEQNELQNALNANFTADLIDDRLQLAAQANISRSAISAFGVQPGSGGVGANSNSTELRSLQITPTLRGPLGPGVRYTASLAQALTSAANSGTGDSTSTTANLRLEPVAAGRLGWSVDASHLASDFKQGRGTQSSRLIGGLRLDLDALDLQLNATGGLERSNLTTLEASSTNTWGMGLLWRPSPVTRLSAEFENRSFGRTHGITLERRTPRTAFIWRMNRSLLTNGNQTLGAQGPAYGVIALQYAAILDPLAREAAIQQRLRDLGLASNDIVAAGFLQSAATLQDLQEFSATWNGLRDTAVLTLSRSKTRRIDTLSSAIDDLSQSDRVTLNNLSLSLSHRLTPLSSLSLLMSAQRGVGSGAALFNRQATADLQFSTSLTPESTANVSLRHGQYRTGLLTYGENTLTATYGLRF